LPSKKGTWWKQLASHQPHGRFLFAPPCSFGCAPQVGAPWLPAAAFSQLLRALAALISYGRPAGRPAVSLAADYGCAAWLLRSAWLRSQPLHPRLSGATPSDPEPGERHGQLSAFSGLALCFARSSFLRPCFGVAACYGSPRATHADLGVRACSRVEAMSNA
jgi:hypothetical protein